jgi:hypothetical protein
MGRTMRALGGRSRMFAFEQVLTADERPLETAFLSPA